jgi:hypothetical protein
MPSGLLPGSEPVCLESTYVFRPSKLTDLSIHDLLLFRYSRSSSVQIGIPVPREPFSFGGLYGTQSKFGDMDITGDGGMEFFTNRIKISSKWPLVRAAEVQAINGVTDHANFTGTM